MGSLPKYLTPATADELDAAEQLAELDATIVYLRDSTVERLAALPICDRCLDTDSLRAVLDDVLRDATHGFRMNAIEKLEGEQ